MPKIFINEKDNTSAGASGSYANFAVLVAGFADTSKTASDDDKVKPDANGVYEFTSYDDFEKIIGLCKPAIASGKTTNWHYGNQMAYELLKLGYPVIYKRIDNIMDLQEPSFWEIFKDKASYDFRFITHGLLESSDTSDIEGYTELVRIINALKELKTAVDGIASKTYEDLKDDELFISILNKNHPQGPEEGYDMATEIAEWQMIKYQGSETDKITGIYDGYEKDFVGTGLDFSTYATAIQDVGTTLTTKEGELDTATKGLVSNTFISKANTCIANLATYVAQSTPSRDIPGRGDCVALIELDESKYVGLNGDAAIKAIITEINTSNYDSIADTETGKYCAMTIPSVHYKRSYDEKDPFDNNNKFPGAFHYLACFINAQKQGFAEWYATAGYTRGVSSLTIDHTTVKLGEVAINALEPRFKIDNTDPKFACNVIANFRGNYYLWGNRTAFPLFESNHTKYGNLTASSFLNIRQLCSTIKKQLYVACRKFTFDPNSDTLWINFCNAIRPTLEAMKADQGVKDYKIVKVQEANPAKATLKAKIRIIPIEAVEDFDLEVSLEDSFGETTAVVAE
jgi:hypothetical protein